MSLDLGALYLMVEITPDGATRFNRGLRHVERILTFDLTTTLTDDSFHSVIEKPNQRRRVGAIHKRISGHSL